MSKKLISLFIISMAPFVNANSADTYSTKSGWALTGGLGGIAGIGGEIGVAKALRPDLNLRLSYSRFSWDLSSAVKNLEDNKVKVNDATAKLSFNNISLLADYYPFSSSTFHLSGGLLLPNNKVTFNNIRVEETDPLGNIYTAQADLTLSYKNAVAPYIGLGFGNPVAADQSWGFSFNVGVAFSGSPKLDINKKYSNNIPPQYRTDIDKEIDDIKSDINGKGKSFNVLPMVSLSVTYQF